VKPSWEMAAAIIGVLKTGCAFLYMEPGTPGERINVVLNDSHMNILLTQTGIRETFNPGAETVNIEDPGLYGDQSQNPDYDVKPADPVYVTYISGPGRHPNGVLITNQNLVNYTSWFIKTLRLTPADRAILTSSYSLDAHYAQLFSTLIMGGQLHVTPPGIFLYAEQLLGYLKEHKITYIKVTPALFNLIADSPGFSPRAYQKLRFLMWVGEEITVKDLEKAHTLCPHLEIMIHCGPPETTIGSI
ncbi:MAG: amino acid adenylation domain-containing protein, partial [bacterium]|nr:amino acid adenylation domain-containing protein [bacterium]